MAPGAEAAQAVRMDAIVDIFQRLERLNRPGQIAVGNGKTADIRAKRCLQGSRFASINDGGNAAGPIDSARAKRKLLQLFARQQGDRSIRFVDRLVGRARKPVMIEQKLRQPLLQAR